MAWRVEDPAADAVAADDVAVDAVAVDAVAVDAVAVDDAAASNADGADLLLGGVATKELAGNAASLTGSEGG